MSVADAVIVAVVEGGSELGVVLASKVEWCSYEIREYFFNLEKSERTSHVSRSSFLT